ncbi:hypothetical protein PFISCL1PPCAC_26213, partial [Pristionchus fissidentatus]
IGPAVRMCDSDRIRGDASSNEYIELLTLRGCLFGLTIGGVQEVINEGKHCILDVIYDKAIRCLKTANIRPFVILVKPSSPVQIRRWNNGEMSDEESEVEFKRCQRDERMFGDLVTHIITEATSFEDIFQQVLEIVCGEQFKMKECVLWMGEEPIKKPPRIIPLCRACGNPARANYEDDLRRDSWLMPISCCTK